MKDIKQLIREATGIADASRIEAIERCMRAEVFVSTLEWIPEERLVRGAPQAFALVRERDAAHFICMEFKGKGDPFFGGNADDRALLTDGFFGHSDERNPAARYLTARDAIAAGERAPNRRSGAVVGAVPLQAIPVVRH